MIDQISYLERDPEPGETVFGRSYSQGFGGKGANQAVMASLLGGKVDMVACIGQDLFARAWLDHFSHFGVSTRHVRRIEDAHSGVASVWVTPSGQNRIVLGSGANAALCPDMVDAVFADIEPPDVVLSQLEVSQSAIRSAFSHARRIGVVTVLNPGPAAPIDAGLLQLTDWLLPNETELRLLARSMYGLEHDDDIVLAQEFSMMSHIDVVVTLGERGAVWASPMLDSPIAVAAPVVPVVDTTGAGDAFAGAFAFALGQGRSIHYAMRLAVAVASDSVTKAGTAISFSRDAQLRSIVDAVAAEMSAVDAIGSVK